MGSSSHPEQVPAIHQILPSKVIQNEDPAILYVEGKFQTGKLSTDILTLEVGLEVVGFWRWTWVRTD
jgi:hypothetical protein